MIPMRNILIPATLILAGLGAGGGAGFMMRPDETANSATNEDAALSEIGVKPSALPAPVDKESETDQEAEFVKLPNQFVVPIVQSGVVSSLVVLSLSLEVAAGSNEAVILREPKLRDQILRLLFDHANSGGFDGTFTDAAGLSVLRRGLLDVSRQVLGPIVSDVLITDIMRQDS